MRPGLCAAAAAGGDAAAATRVTRPRAAAAPAAILPLLQVRPECPTDRRARQAGGNAMSVLPGTAAAKAQQQQKQQLTIFCLALFLSVSNFLSNPHPHLQSHLKCLEALGLVGRKNALMRRMQPTQTRGAPKRYSPPNSEFLKTGAAEAAASGIWAAAAATPAAPPFAAAPAEAVWSFSGSLRTAGSPRAYTPAFWGRKGGLPASLPGCGEAGGTAAASQSHLKPIEPALSAPLSAAEASAEQSRTPFSNASQQLEAAMAAASRQSETGPLTARAPKLSASVLGLRV